MTALPSLRRRSADRPLRGARSCAHRPKPSVASGNECLSCIVVAHRFERPRRRPSAQGQDRPSDEDEHGAGHQRYAQRSAADSKGSRNAPLCGHDHLGEGLSVGIAAAVRKGSTIHMLRQSSKLANVLYDIRGPVLEEAQAMAAAGQTILKLNIGNPAPFGSEAPDASVQDVAQHLPVTQGSSASRGILSARRAVAQYDETRAIHNLATDEVFLGNGVSELITLSPQALCNPGDEILVPGPDYPLWTASVALSGGSPVHYRCAE